MNPRRLYRCRHDRIIAGVASGMAEYLGLDPTVVRILWILSTLLGGLTILLYIILAFVMPLEPYGVAGEAGAPGTTGTPGGTGWGTATGEAGTEPGADAATGAAPTAAWGTAPTAGWHNPTHEHRPGRMGLYVGVMLVVFGAIAMANVLIPGLVAGGLLGAGLLVALGVALLVGATRPSAADR